MELSKERKGLLHSLFTTALEGGINYWACVSEYHWSNGSPGLDPLAHCDLDGFYAVVEPSDGEWGVFDDHAKDRGPLRIDQSVMVTGLSRWREWMAGEKRNQLGGLIVPTDNRDYISEPYAPSREYWHRFYRDEGQNDWEVIDYDAELTDAIVQLGLFDAVVYG